MARNTKSVTIDAPGRDQGRTYLLTEMSASQAERWATRAFLALAKSGVQLPDGAEQMGMAGIAAAGIKALAGLEFADAGPLLDEMFSCVQFVPDPRRPAIPVRALIETDIDEVATRLRLRAEVFALHVGFFPPGALSSFVTLVKMRLGALASAATSTSAPPSAP